MIFAAARPRAAAVLLEVVTAAVVARRAPRRLRRVVEARRTPATAPTRLAWPRIGASTSSSASTGAGSAASCTCLGVFCSAILQPYASGARLFALFRARAQCGAAPVDFASSS